KKLTEAQQVLDENKGKLAPAEADLTLAQAYFLIENFDESRKLYLKLVETRSNELNVLKLAGGFFFRSGDTATAGPLMEKILAHPNRTPIDTDYARRMLALCAVVSGNHKSGVRALGI